MTDNQNDRQGTGRKEWRTPVVILATLDATEAGATPLVTEGAFAFGS